MKVILICDDEEQFANPLKEGLEKLPSLKADFKVDTLKEDEFQETMETLKKRQIALRKNGEWDGERIRLDETAIFIVDFDLLYSRAGDFLTGEYVAYLVRCFTTCGLIVGLNLPPYRDNVFDLTLRGHPDSFADLNIGGRQLNNSGLWEGVGAGFRPWYWPALPSYLRDFEKKVDDVKKNLAADTPIYQVLSFTSDTFEMLPRSIAQFLGKEPARTTVRQFVKDSGNGLRPKDGLKANDDVLARVGAARISKWLERLVLPGQDILVDAPHLVVRYPSLLTGDVKDIETWNKTARLTSHEELGISADLIELFRLKKDHWLSRPVWFWDRLRECTDITEVKEPWKFKKPDWVFCEDMSRFYDSKYCREFVAEVESPYARRFVGNFDDVDYRPALRFSL